MRIKPKQLLVLYNVRVFSKLEVKLVYNFHNAAIYSFFKVFSKVLTLLKHWETNSFVYLKPKPNVSYHKILYQ